MMYLGVSSKNQLNKTQEWAFLHYSGSCNFIQFSVTWGGDLMVEDQGSTDRGSIPRGAFRNFRVSEIHILSCCHCAIEFTQIGMLMILFRNKENEKIRKHHGHRFLDPSVYMYSKQVCVCEVLWYVYVCLTDYLYWKMPWPQAGAVVSAINYNSKDQTPLLRREESARYKQAVKWKTTSVFICFSQRWPHLVILTENYFHSLQRVKKVQPAICFLWECCNG